MTRNLRGVVRGGRIELPADAGLVEGQEFEVVLRPVAPPPDGGAARVWGDGIRASAGCLAHLPDEVFDELDELVGRRNQWRIREVDE